MLKEQQGAHYFHRVLLPLPPSVGVGVLGLLGHKAPDVTQCPTCALFCLTGRVSKSSA